MPVGTFKIHAATEREVQSYLSKIRQGAFYRLMGEEVGVQEGVIKRITDEANVKSGFWNE